MRLEERALRAKRESKHVEFKNRFDAAASGAWCEIIKDIVAIANSGGGAIVFGLDSKVPAGTAVETVLVIDPATITDKIHSYTEVQFADFEIQEGKKATKRVALLSIGSVRVPMVFTSPWTYPDSGKQKTAFGRGTLYSDTAPRVSPPPPATWLLSSSAASPKCDVSG